MKQKQTGPDVLKRFSQWLSRRGEAEAEMHLYNASRLADWATEGLGKGLTDLNELDMMRFFYDVYIRETDGHGRQVSVLPESVEMFYRYLKVVEGLPEDPDIFKICTDKARYRRRLETYRNLDPGSAEYPERRKQWEQELEEWIDASTQEDQSASGLSTPGRRIEVTTILFAALNGFLEMTCAQSLARTGEQLDAFYMECGEAIFGHGGEVARFVGDGVLAFFPVELTVQAGQAGLDLASRMKRLIEKWEAPDLGFGLGIHTGEALLGTFGHPHKRGFDVVGNPVALAALMARKGRLLVSKAALDASKGRLDVSHHQAVDVRWARQLLHAFELRGEGE